MSLIEAAAEGFVRSVIADVVERAVSRQMTLSIHARTGRLTPSAGAFLGRRRYAIAEEERDRCGLEGERQALTELGYLRKGLFGWRRTDKPVPPILVVPPRRGNGKKA